MIQGHDLIVNRQNICKNCNKVFDRIDLYKHHTSYVKDETVLVCHVCHMKIHKDVNHPLFPIDLDSPQRAKLSFERYRKYGGKNRMLLLHIKPVCGTCGNNSAFKYYWKGENWICPSCLDKSVGEV